MDNLRLDIFEHIVYHLRLWYQNYHKIEKDDFFIVNDFSILKIIKLDFLVAAINSHQQNLILENSEYYAMPYGPVETSVYNSLRNNSLNGYSFSKRRLETIKDELPFIENSIEKEIINAISILKSNEPNLINADAGTLVDLTHKWQSWKKNYSLARKLGMFSMQIPNDEIRDDIKVVAINNL